MRGWTPRKSESTSVGTSQSDMEERLPLSRWPPPLHRHQQGRIPSWTAAAGSFPPALRAGGALPTSHPEQLSPGCPVHEPEGPEPLAAPLPQSAITPTGAAVAPAPSLPPVRTGPSPPQPRTACGSPLCWVSYPLHHRRGQSRLCCPQGMQPGPSGRLASPRRSSQPAPQPCSRFIGSGARRAGWGSPPTGSAASSWPSSHLGCELWH